MRTLAIVPVKGFGEAKQRLAWLEEAARMGFEGECGGGSPEHLGARERGGDDSAVTAVHAIEITDGKHRTTQHTIVGRRVAHQGEWSKRL